MSTSQQQTTLAYQQIRRETQLSSLGFATCAAGVTSQVGLDPATHTQTTAHMVHHITGMRLALSASRDGTQKDAGHTLQEKKNKPGNVPGSEY
jgi:hypothetical protein